jgi:hypothetical protein
MSPCIVWRDVPTNNEDQLSMAVYRRLHQHSGDERDDGALDGILWLHATG